jgi:NAD-dependent dihydropyrimidine dehydrogenase PreA subunit
VIELISASRCTECDICVRICPTNVFDAVEGGVPVIARHSDCQTCFQCEAYCPADAIFVAAPRTPLPDDSPLKDEAVLAEQGLLGLYRDRVGWRRGAERDTPVSTDDYHPAPPPRRTP